MSVAPKVRRDEKRKLRPIVGTFVFLNDRFAERRTKPLQTVIVSPAISIVICTVVMLSFPVRPVDQGTEGAEVG